MVAYLAVFMVEKQKYDERRVNDILHQNSELDRLVESWFEWPHVWRGVGGKSPYLHRR